MGSKKKSVAPGWSEAEARDVLESWSNSGETGAAYARAIGVVPQRLFYWRRRLERARDEAPTFVPVVVASKVGAACAPITVVIGAARIEIAEASGATAAWVATLLGVGS
ncbi:MAG: hypothetical protein ABIO72_02525 [Patescibacteria group bacterium]